MATFAELTAEQQADLGRYDLFLRGVFSSLARLGRDADVDQWNTFATVNVDPVLATLGPAELIPTMTGLGGAKPLTQAEFLELQGIARQLRALLERERTLLVKAIGVNA
jgi:hypothetical protein